MALFQWKPELNRDALTHYGYIAQEVEKTMPDQVQTDGKGYKSVNYIEVLVKKLNDLENKVAELQKRIDKVSINKSRTNICKFSCELIKSIFLAKAIRPFRRNTSEKKGKK